eukprot:m.129078 g.129078  ORF g.129078 m.129078 type:complete len:411 (+) comp14746_c10_seq1:128-1360(+)
MQSAEAFSSPIPIRHTLNQPQPLSHTTTPVSSRHAARSLDFSSSIPMATLESLESQRTPAQDRGNQQENQPNGNDGPTLPTAAEQLAQASRPLIDAISSTPNIQPALQALETALQRCESVLNRPNAEASEIEQSARGVRTALVRLTTHPALTQSMGVIAMPASALSSALHRIVMARVPAPGATTNTTTTNTNTEISPVPHARVLQAQQYFKPIVPARARTVSLRSAESSDEATEKEGEQPTAETTTNINIHLEKTQVKPMPTIALSFKATRREHKTKPGAKPKATPDIYEKIEGAQQRYLSLRKIYLQHRNRLAGLRVRAAELRTQLREQARARMTVQRIPSRASPSSAAMRNPAPAMMLPAGPAGVWPLTMPPNVLPHGYAVPASLSSVQAPMMAGPTHMPYSVMYRSA